MAIDVRKLVPDFMGRIGLARVEIPVVKTEFSQVWTATSFTELLNILADLPARVSVKDVNGRELDLAGKQLQEEVLSFLRTGKRELISPIVNPESQSPSENSQTLPDLCVQLLNNTFPDLEISQAFDRRSSVSQITPESAEFSVKGQNVVVGDPNDRSVRELTKHVENSLRSERAEVSNLGESGQIICVAEGIGHRYSWLFAQVLVGSLHREAAKLQQALEQGTVVTNQDIEPAVSAWLQATLDTVIESFVVQMESLDPEMKSDSSMFEETGVALGVAVVWGQQVFSYNWGHTRVGALRPDPFIQETTGATVYNYQDFHQVDVRGTDDENLTRYITPQRGGESMWQDLQAQQWQLQPGMRVFAASNEWSQYQGLTLPSSSDQAESFSATLLARRSEISGLQRNLPQDDATLVMGREYLVSPVTQDQAELSAQTQQYIAEATQRNRDAASVQEMPQVTIDQTKNLSEMSAELLSLQSFEELVNIETEDTPTGVKVTTITLNERYRHLLPDLFRGLVGVVNRFDTTRAMLSGDPEDAQKKLTDREDKLRETWKKNLNDRLNRGLPDTQSLLKGAAGDYALQAHLVDLESAWLKKVLNQA